MKKTMYIIISIITLLIVLILLGRKSVHHELTINASEEQVWKILINTDEYPNWNPVMKLLEGKIQKRNKVKYQFTQDKANTSKISATVARIIPNKLLNQNGGIPLILTFNHKYMLESKGNTTKITIHEDYRGIGVFFWNPQPVEEAYKLLNIAFKKRAEQNEQNRKNKINK